MQGASPSSPAGFRLWRPAAQRRVRNSWSSISKHAAAWAAASSHGFSAATSLVNAILSERYVESMDFGVLKAMAGIKTKARKKFVCQGEVHCMELLRSYRDLVENLSMMIKGKGSMRTYLKGQLVGNLVEFSSEQQLSDDTGDGDGVAVFSALSVSTHEMLAQELVSMFLMETHIKWRIVSELHFVFYSLEGDIQKKQLLKEMLQCVVEEMSAMLAEMSDAEQLPDAMQHPQQGSDFKVKREVLQVYLTAWLAEVNIRKSRREEILRLVSEELQCTL